MEQNKGHVNFYIWIYAFFAIVSIFAIGSAGAALAAYRHVSPFWVIFKQIAFLIAGFIFMLAVGKLDYRVYFKLADAFYFISLFLLIITLFFAPTVNAARRWLVLPGLGLHFQTSELVKIAVIIKVAQILATEKNMRENTDQLLKKVAFWVLPIVFLVMLGDNSSALLIFFTVILMLFIAPIDRKLLLKYLGLLTLLFVVFFLLGLLVGIGRFNTMLARAKNFLLGEDYYQALQAKIAVATGHLFIPIPGSSTQKALLTHSYSDFIFAILAEEWGIWAFIIVIVYLIFIYKTGEIIKKINRSFPLFLASGIVFSITLQAFVHISVNIGLLPITGQPLPLISLGGTSIIMTSFAFGILLNISRNKAAYQLIMKEKNNAKNEKNDSEKSEENKDIEPKMKNEEWKELLISDFDI